MSRFRTLNMHSRHPGRRFSGFTLVALVFGVLALGVLVAMIVPLLGAPGEGARVSALKTELSALRNAIELYQVEHNGRYPGEFLASDGATRPATSAAARTAFLAQLSGYTDASGVTGESRTDRFRHGPYLDNGALPVNVFLSGPAASDVLVDIVETEITARPVASGTTGWKFHARTGRLVANDGVILSDGSTATVDF